MRAPFRVRVYWMDGSNNCFTDIRKVASKRDEYVVTHKDNDEELHFPKANIKQLLVVEQSYGAVR